MNRDINSSIDKSYFAAATNILATTEKSLQRKTKTKAKTKVVVEEENLPGRQLLAIPRLGVKATVSLLELAADPRSREMVTQLTEEVTVLDASSSSSLSLDPSSNQTRSPMMALPTSITSANVAVTELFSSEQPGGLFLSGKRVAFTGKLASMTRSQAESVCERLGNIFL